MPADRLLTNVLRAYQTPSDPVQLSKILSTTTSLLTTLSNPLNVTLLTSHLLRAPTVWNLVDGLTTSLRIISIFNTAAITVLKHQAVGHTKPYDAYQPRLGGGISTDDWARAVVKGLDDRTPRWQHALVLCGVLIGMEGQDREGLSRSLRATLENAMVTAVNLALDRPASTGALGSGSVVLALNHAFPLLSDGVRTAVNYDALIIPMIKTMTSAEGYQEANFLQAIDYDVKQASGSKFAWPESSASFLQLQKLASKPIVASMGPLSRLVAHAIENVRNPLLVVEVREHLVSFTTGILQKWQKNKLSEIDPSEEATFLTPDTLRITFPVLWQILKTVMFAVVVILRSVIGRTLLEPVLASPQLAPETASQTLLILSKIHFISSRVGSHAFSAYTFVNLASIDILTRFPASSLSFLRSIYPPHAGQIPSHPLHRNHDLFYLNTAEHFTLCLTPSDAESLIVTPSTPYLSPTANAHLLEIFEAAHSSMLAVLAAPQNEHLTAHFLPFYVDSLFASFPQNLSPRQFRFAFKALMQICTPPNPLARSQPLMAETLLELLHHRALHAPTTPLPPAVAASMSKPNDDSQATPLSEQAILLLTLLDALPSVTLPVLETWLPLAADLHNVVADPTMREVCKRRFWEVLEGGEMDVDRSAVCVAWWGTRGGRERVVFGAEGGPFMSGGLGLGDGDGHGHGVGRESRL